MTTNETSETGRNMGGWHLDRRVPIALIVAIIMQTSAGIWWVANVEARIVSNERAITTIQNDAKDGPSRLARIEVQLESIRSTLLRVENRIDRQEERTYRNPNGQ